EMATAPARSWFLRSEAWSARRLGEPLFRSIRKCEGTAEIGRAETPDANAMGCDGDSVTGICGNHRRYLDVFPQSNTVDAGCAGKKHRSTSVCESERRQR